MNREGWRDGEVKRWRDREMGRWRDGEMEGWKDKITNKLQINKQNEFRNQNYSYIYLYVLKFTCKTFYRFCHDYMVKYYNSLPKNLTFKNNGFYNSFEFYQCGPIFKNIIPPTWILLRYVIRNEQNLIDWMISMDILPKNLRDKKCVSSKFGLDNWQKVWKYAGYHKNIKFLKWCSQKYKDENWY